MTWIMPGNLTGVGDILVYVSEQSGGKFAILIVISIYIIIFVSAKISQLETNRSLLLASFITFILSSIAYGGKFVSGNIVVFLLAMTILSMIWTFASD